VWRNRGLWAGACWAAALAVAPALAQTAPPVVPELRGGEADLVGQSDADALPDLPAVEQPASQRRTAKPPRTRGRLPALRPYRGADRLGLRGGADAVTGTPAPTVAALPAPPPRRKIKRDDKPFDPVGLYVGDLRLTPYVEQDIGYASNPFGVPSPAKGSALSQTEIGVALQSDWSHSALTGSAKVGYNDYFQTPSASAPYGAGVLDYRYDASRDLSFDTEGRFNVANETNAQLGLSGSAAESLTMVSTYGATLGGVDKFGDLSVGLHGTVDRLQYGGGDLATDDYNDYGLKLRTGYRLSEAVQPFAEIGGDVRVYDDHYDASGYDRASDGLYGKAGVTLALSEMLKGEASLGYGAREYRDPRLPNAGAPLFDASLIWSATPLTTVTLRAATALQDAVIAAASADIARNYTINLDHSFTERFKFGLNAGLGTDDYVGTNQTDRNYTLGATAEYHLSREVVLKASATHQQFVSNTPGSNFVADTVMLGVRLQR
jgi:hypothetical protein